MTIRWYVRPQYLAFARESRNPPGPGTILVAEGDGRYWWVHDPFRVDGVEWFPPQQPEHRCVQPLTARVGQKSLDYDNREHKLVRLNERPAALMEALQRAKNCKTVRIVQRKLGPVWWYILKARCWRAWRWLRDRARRLSHRGRRQSR